MGKKRMAQLCGKSGRRLCRKKLRRDRAHKTDDAKRHQKQAHPHNITPVPAGNAYVDYRRHYQRHKQLQQRLQHLKQRRQHRFLFVSL